MKKAQTKTYQGWEVKLKFKQDNYEQIECRKTFGGSQILIIVGLDGWDASAWDKRYPDKWGNTSMGKNVRLSMNQAAPMTFTEFREIDEVVVYAHNWLLERVSVG